MKVGVFPGSFDPFTLGHFEVVNKALGIFDKIIVAVGSNNEKNSYYSLNQKIEMIQKLYKDRPEVEVAKINGLTVDFCKQNKATHIIRGLRNSADFEYERNIADTNKVLAEELTTLFFLTPSEYSAVSSGIVRDLLKHGADVSKFVPQEIIEDIKNFQKK